jgi:anti-anti-sigma factor
MKIETKKTGDTMTFDLAEDITYENSEQLFNYIFDSLDKNTKKAILKIDKVNYINSFALGVLIKILQEVEKKGMEFYLMDVPPEVRTLLKITGIISKFRILGKDD